MAKSTKLEVGSKRFYPPHGVVTLVAVEEREFAGTSEEFHVLELVRGGSLLVPTKAMANTAFRPLITVKKARELQKHMRSKAKAKIEPKLEGKERANKYDTLLKAGDPDDYTEILRELMLRSATGKITLNEQKLMETARVFFVDEVGSILKLNANEFLAEVARAAAAAEGKAEDAEEAEDDDG